MKTHILTFILAFICMSSVAQTDTQQIISKITESAASLKTMKCVFVQTKSIRLLNDKMVSKGRMCYKQANKLRWEYQKPYTYIFILDEDKVSLVRQGRTDVIDVNQNAMFKEIVSIMMSSIVGTCLSDNKSFQTSIEDEPLQYVVTLIPRTKRMKQMYSKLTLLYSKEQNLVTQVEMYEKNGDKTTIELIDVQKNVELETDAFSGVGVLPNPGVN